MEEAGLFRLTGILTSMGNERDRRMKKAWKLRMKEGKQLNAQTLQGIHLTGEGAETSRGRKG